MNGIKKQYNIRIYRYILKLAIVISKVLLLYYKLMI